MAFLWALHQAPAINLGLGLHAGLAVCHGRFEQFNAALHKRVQGVRFGGHHMPLNFKKFMTIKG